MAGTSRPPPEESFSPNTAVPKTALPNKVTALLDVMAGARMPVFRADCWSTNPTRAETMST